MKHRLKDKIKESSSLPGVYHFLDENGLVLYVGKAKNLKNRLKQYFQKELRRGPGIEQMVAMARDIRWIETDSEIEAVLLEADLIKKLKPKYNVRQKDDKSFLVIKITKKISNSEFLISNPPAGEAGKKPKAKNQKMREISERFPVVELVRFNNVDFSDKSADYFGPYPSGLLLKKSMRYLRKIFPYRDCTKTKFHISERNSRPCLYGDIGVCSAPCAGKVTDIEYEKNIRYLKSFLRGHKKSIIASLERAMKKLSREKKFEEAAVIRNRLLALNHLKNVRIGLRDDLYNFDSSVFARIECYDISNILTEHAVGSMVVFTNGKIDKDEYRKFKIKGELTNDLSRLKEVLNRRFKTNWPLPNLVIIDGGEQQLRLAKETLKEFNLSIPLVSISKGPKRDKNDFHYSDQSVAKYFEEGQDLKKIAISAIAEAHRFAISYYRTLHKKELFK